MIRENGLYKRDEKEREMFSVVNPFFIIVRIPFRQRYFIFPTGKCRQTGAWFFMNSFPILMITSRDTFIVRNPTRRERIIVNICKVVPFLLNGTRESYETRKIVPYWQNVNCSISVEEK